MAVLLHAFKARKRNKFSSLPIRECRQKTTKNLSGEIFSPSKSDKGDQRDSQQQTSNRYCVKRLKCLMMYIASQLQRPILPVEWGRLPSEPGQLVKKLPGLLTKRPVIMSNGVPNSPSLGLTLHQSYPIHFYNSYQPFKDEAQTALFKDPLRTAQ